MSGTYTIPGYTIPGDFKCDYCGELLDNGLEYTFFSTLSEPIRLYHVVCQRAFSLAMSMHMKHQLLCHKDGCDIQPKPVRWVDSVGGYQT